MFDRFKKTDENNPEALGSYPRKANAGGMDHRRADKVNRYLAIAGVIMLLIILIMVSLFRVLFPLKQVYPLLLQAKSGQEQIVHVEPFTIDGKVYEHVSEALIREYIDLRHSFVANTDIQTLRWVGKKFVDFNTPEAYQQFINNDRRAYDTLRQDGYVRDIKISNVAPLDETFWQATFTTIDTKEGTPAVTTINTRDGNQAVQARPGFQSTWRATMRIKYDPQAVVIENRLVNPLGFKVTEYSVSVVNGEGS